MWVCSVVVVVDAHVVLGKAHGPRPDVDVGQHRHVVVGGLGHIDPRHGLEWLAERDRDSAPNEPGRGGDASGGEMVESSSLAVVVPATPVRDRVEELTELLRGHVHKGHPGDLTGDAVDGPRAPVVPPLGWSRASAEHVDGSGDDEDHHGVGDQRLDRH